MQGFKWTHIAPVFAAFALVYCGSPASRGTNLTIDSKQADLNIQSRLMQTDQARDRLEKLLDALQPFHTALRDVGKVLRKSDEDFADRVQHLDQDLRKALQEASKGLAQTQPDGSWVIKRRVSLNIPRKEGTCVGSEIKITGSNTPQGDQMEVLLFDCALREPLPIANFLARAGKLEIQYFPNSLERLVDTFDTTFELGKCTVQVERDFSDLQCEPMNFRGNGFAVSISAAEFRQDRQGTRAHFVVHASEHGADGQAEAKLITEPGLPPRVELRFERNGKKHEWTRNI